MPNKNKNNAKVGSNNPPPVLSPSLQVRFKPPVTERRDHYLCPDCKRKYFSRIETNGVCKYCSSNPKLESNLRRKKEKPSKDEINMDLGLFSHKSRHKTPFSFVYVPQVFDGEDEEDVENELANLDEDLDDFDFEPPARDFDINMRLTSGPQRWKDGARDPKNVITSPLLIKTFGGQIGQRAGRPVTTARPWAWSSREREPSRRPRSRIAPRLTSRAASSTTSGATCSATLLVARPPRRTSWPAVTAATPTWPRSRCC